MGPERKEAVLKREVQRISREIIIENPEIFEQVTGYFPSLEEYEAKIRRGLFALFVLSFQSLLF